MQIACAAGVACVVFGLFIFLVKGSGCSPCGNDPAEPEGLKTVEVGRVTMGNESCVVEEVQQRFDRCVEPEPNPAKRCRETVRCSRPLVRRVTCPSGNNGQSNVTREGPKQGKEVVK